MLEADADVEQLLPPNLRDQVYQISASNRTVLFVPWGFITSMLKFLLAINIVIEFIEYALPPNPLARHGHNNRIRDPSYSMQVHNRVPLDVEVARERLDNRRIKKEHQSMFLSLYPHCVTAAMMNMIHPSQIGNGECDAELNIPQCNYDDGDCAKFNQLFPKCVTKYPERLFDDWCDAELNVEECGYDNGACR